MSRSRRYLYVLLALCIALLSLGFILGEAFWFALLPVGLGTLIAWGLRRDGRWVSFTILAGLTGLAALGFLLGYPFLPFLISSILALAAWDLDDFSRRALQSASPLETERLERCHLLLLIQTLAAGTVLSALALIFSLNINFAGAALLSLALAFSLSHIVRLLRTNSQEAK